MLLLHCFLLLFPDIVYHILALHLSYVRPYNISNLKQSEVIDIVKLFELSDTWTIYCQNKAIKTYPLFVTLYIQIIDITVKNQCLSITMKFLSK